MNSVRSQLRSKMRNKEYRDAFVAEQIFSRLPLKIRGLREQRKLSQKELGEKAGGMAQAWVSKLEDPNYGKLTISTLLRIASACDVGLYIDFVPFSQVLNSATTLSEECFSVPSFDEDSAMSGEELDALSASVRVGLRTVGPLPLNYNLDIGNVAVQTQRVAKPSPDTQWWNFSAQFFQSFSRAVVVSPSLEYEPESKVNNPAVKKATTIPITAKAA